MKHIFQFGVTSIMRLNLLIALGTLLLITSCSNVGETAPAFKLKTIDGQVIDSDSLKGKIIVVNVWATWCPACIQEIPSLNRLQAKYANDTNIVFLALCDDGTRDMRVIFERHPLNYLNVPNAGATTKKLMTKLVKTYPQNLIINSDMQIVFEVTESTRDVYDVLDLELQEILEKQEDLF